MNKTKLIVKNQIQIAATPDTVWGWLTDPSFTPKYMYGCAATSDWEVGSPLLWNADYEGKEMTFVKGSIVAIDPGKYLEYTTFDPNNTSIPDEPQNYLTVTYLLEPHIDGTLLTVTQGDYAVVAQGEKRYTDAIQAGGWDGILKQIKTLAESPE